MARKRAIIIGAGPAGLTAAYELLKRTDIKPIVIEKSDAVGGLSRTVNFKGNRMDIGGHRFFTKSDRVRQWWRDILPVPGDLLTVKRQSRFYFDGKFYDYPPRMSLDLVRGLGLWRMNKIMASYLKIKLFPLAQEDTLEQLWVNRFGRELSSIFFIPYGEKVWGLPAGEISASWGVQRIKGLSVAKVLKNAARKAFARQGDTDKDNTETSLIDFFWYPKYGAGQMWQEVAKQIKSAGGNIITGFEVIKISKEGDRIGTLTAVNKDNGGKKIIKGDYFFSTMPMGHLARTIEPFLPEVVMEVANGLCYRDLLVVGLVIKRVSGKDKVNRIGGLKDHWIYVQDPSVLLGRVDVFNNWSPYMARDPENMIVGAEYFCSETDDIWLMPDKEVISLAAKELSQLKLIDMKDVLEATVIRAPKAYPAYWGTYDRFDELRDYLDGFENLFLIGRNGMHRYNNQDHSMLAAMTAVDNILAGRIDKSNVWAVNTERKYHEEK